MKKKKRQLTDKNGLHVVYSQNFIVRKSAGKRGARFIGVKGTLEFDFNTSTITFIDHYSDKVETITLPNKHGHSGGDDYLVKPFSPSELLLKVDSLVRRYRVYKGKQAAPETDTLRLDGDRTGAVKDGQIIDLTDKGYEILRYFMDNRGEVIDVRTLYENVWGEKYLSSSNNTVMVHVLNLRKKLEADPANPRLIRTVWGKGYQFG